MFKKARYAPLRGTLGKVSLPESAGELEGGGGEEQKIDCQENADWSIKVGEYLHGT